MKKTTPKKIQFLVSASLLLLSIFLFTGSVNAVAQDWVKTGTNLGVERIRLAVADFKPASNDPQTPSLKNTFDGTLYSDLAAAGIFDMVSKSMAPTSVPGSPQEIVLKQWADAPSNAAMVVFGALAVRSGRIVVNGFLFDAKNEQSPQVLGKQYTDIANQDNARLIAHKFADEIILRLGGGINGIAETKIYYVSSRSGSKEIWVMDYDGQGQRQITRLGQVSLSPRISPNNTRIAFSSLSKEGWSIRMFSMELSRLINFPSGGGTTLSPAWAPDGNRLAFSSSRSGDPEIWIVDANGSNPRRLTNFRGAGCFPCVESEDRKPARLVQRSHRPSADLHHGLRWRRHSAHDRRRICHLAFMVAEWPVPHLRMGSQVRPRCSRRAGHLRHGHCQQALAAAHA